MSDPGPDLGDAPQFDVEPEPQAEVHAGAQPTPDPDAGQTVRIVQGHPTGFEPDANKGGQNGAPKPDGRSATEVLAQASQAGAAPLCGADAGAGPDDPGRGGD
jgi:hypothetical protein